MLVNIIQMLSNYLGQDFAHYNCTICNKKFDSEDDLFKHTTDIHPQIECKACEQKYSSELALEWHLETEHEREILNARDRKKEWTNRNVPRDITTQVNIEEPPKPTQLMK